MTVLPHRPPFLFVDEVTRLDPGVSITARRTLRPEEPHFAGHFPGRPVMPGVLVTEALAQTCGLLTGLTAEALGGAAPEQPAVFFLAADSVKYTSPAGPGDTLTLIAEQEAGHGVFLRFRVEALAGRRRIAAGSLTLARVDGPR
jgi:3-hydroxymyristoyl/3-hydroxydecanoyl-(acyl carrier protein) dehydratase